MNNYSNLFDLFEKSLKFLPYVSSFLIFLITSFKILLNYAYGKKCEETFGIPYSYFMFDFVKSIIETLIYMVLLIGCVFVMFSMVFLAKKEQNFLLLISYTLAHSTALSLFQLGIYINSKNKDDKYYLLKVIILPFIFSVFLFIFQKKCVDLFVIFLSLILMYTIGMLLYNIIIYFINYLEPKNNKYQIVNINKRRYAIVAKNKNSYVLIKLGNKDRIKESNFILVESIIGSTIEYKKIFD